MRKFSNTAFVTIIVVSASIPRYGQAASMDPPLDLGPNFCGALNELIRQAIVDFRQVRGRPDRFMKNSWHAKIDISSGDCSIDHEEEWEYTCSWIDATEGEAKARSKEITTAIRACLPKEWKYRRIRPGSRPIDIFEQADQLPDVTVSYGKSSRRNYWRTLFAVDQQ